MTRPPGRGGGAHEATARRGRGRSGSLLVLSAPDRDEIYIAEEQVTTPAGVLDTVIRYRLNTERAEIIAAWGAKNEDGTIQPPPEFLIQSRLEAFEKKLRRTGRVEHAQRLYVPYWHLTGQIEQGILGRQGDGPKHVRIRAFSVEHTVPAYDKARADFRDDGLRMTRSRVRPLTVKVGEGRRFLPWLPAEERTYREIEKWRMQELEAGEGPVPLALGDRGRRLRHDRRLPADAVGHSAPPAVPCRARPGSPRRRLPSVLALRVRGPDRRQGDPLSGASPCV